MRPTPAPTTTCFVLTEEGPSDAAPLFALVYNAKLESAAVALAVFVVSVVLNQNKRAHTRPRVHHVDNCTHDHVSTTESFC